MPRVAGRATQVMVLAAAVAGCGGTGPTDTVRTAVPFHEAWTSDGADLQVNASSCNGEPEITALEETADQIRLELTATIPAPGNAGDGCLDTVMVPLEQPLGDRALTDVTSGKTVPVEVRRQG
ncbi:hypothetical protein GXB85_15845 [Cellulomonas sp. APG4]|uniref:hypothetical protein n=1 Tax=Cellulomonas sp. APG4 TaxID=1538656 RepID=UPI001379DCB9|nr:hypothetical protein [Cellulomonas sp. APG4]NCT92408.1 hypothetical protein [Cellulomonas sp. APG4]